MQFPLVRPRDGQGTVRLCPAAPEAGALGLLCARGERRLTKVSVARSTPAADTADTVVPAADGPVVAAPGSERPPIRARCDPERRLEVLPHRLGRAEAGVAGHLIDGQ